MQTFLYNNAQKFAKQISHASKDADLKQGYNYINQEKRRTEINEKYSLLDSEEIQKDVSDLIEKQEREKELTEAINMLDDKYKNAIYLTKIKGLSYKETAEILRTNY